MNSNERSSSLLLIVVSLLLLVGGGVLFFLKTLLAVALVQGVVGGVLLVFFLFREVHCFCLFSRKALPLVFSAVVLGVCITVGFLLPFEVDLTERARYSLSPGLRRFAKELKAPVLLSHVQIGEVTRLHREQKLLKKLEEQSPLISREEIDPVFDIARVEALQLEQGDRVVLSSPNSSGGQSSMIHLKELSDTALLMSLQQVSGTAPIRVFYSVGHGELSLDSIGPFGSSRLRTLLAEEGVLLEEYSLAEQGTPPPNDGVLFVAGPEKPFTEKEELYLKGFLSAGGSLFFASSGSAPLPAPFPGEGVLLAKKPLVRIQGEGDAPDEGQSLEFQVRQYRHHPSTTFLTGNASLSFSRVFPILFTSSTMNIFSNREELLRVPAVLHRGGDLLPQQKSGPKAVPVAVAFQTKAGGKVQLIGSSSWLQNRFFDQHFNAEFLRGSLLWIGRTDLGVLPEEVLKYDRATQKILLTSQEQNQVLTLFVVIAQLLVLFGVLLFVVRRRRAFLCRAQGAA
ncbi:GldG family protein [bacterium]|nr:GldG family protein [bacterium]